MSRTPSVFRTAVSAAALAALTATATQAQQADPAPEAAPDLSARAPSYWDFVTADRIARVLVQTAVVQARNFVQVRYDDSSFDFLTGELTLTGLEVREYLDPGRPQVTGCGVTVDRLTLDLTPIDEVGQARLGLTVTGIDAQRGCFEPEIAAILTPLGLNGAAIDRAVIHARYDYPTGAAQITGQAVTSDLAEVTFSTDLSYVGANMSGFRTVPVIYVAAAEVVVTDRGAWPRLVQILPPAVTDPAQVEALLATELPREFGSDFRELTPAQTAFFDDLAAAAAAFVAEPGTLSIAFDPGRPVLLGPNLDDDPDTLFGALAVRNGLPQRPGFTRLSRADIDAARDLAPEGNRVVVLETGRALIRGVGAPRNVADGLEILQPLLDAGDPIAHRLAVDALERRDPARAYGLALALGATGDTSAAATMDRLERALPLAEVIAGQGGARPATLSADDRGAMRSLALDALSGIGTPRNYTQAYAAALLARAAGDAGAAAILDEIDARRRLSSPADAQAWAEAIAAASEAADAVWYQ